MVGAFCFSESKEKSRAQKNGFELCLCWFGFLKGKKNGEGKSTKRAGMRREEKEEKTVLFLKRTITI